MAYLFEKPVKKRKTNKQPSALLVPIGRNYNPQQDATLAKVSARHAAKQTIQRRLKVELRGEHVSQRHLQGPRAKHAHHQR